MKTSDARSQYIWRTNLIPLLCVILFIIASIIVVVAHG